MIVELRIQLQEDENGQNVRVIGPLQNKVLCLGMIELAKKAVLEAQTETPRVLVAAGMPGNLPLKS